MQFPKLREELLLHEAGYDWDGSPCWLIHDPTANRFHRIGWLEFELLSRCTISDPHVILQQIHAETTLRPTEEDLESFILFLEHNQLVQTHTADKSARLSARTKAGRLSLHQWLLHNYLFFRIPLLKPDRFLEYITPLLSPLLNKNAVFMIAVLGTAGLYLAARQWEVFTGSFVNTLTPAGFFSYIIAITLAKCCHELGHAVAAKKAGLRVPRIGIAFMVMFPVLYTDLGEGWILHNYRHRRLISAAGILAEGAIAAISLFLWGISGNGAVRDAMYILAVVSLSRSLLINISPFMRFDGYYILSDHFNLPNLQQRAFVYTRYLLRQYIFGRSEEAPEYIPQRIIIFFTVYSLATWLYRLVIFFGIALTVYHFFFKSLGILLMLVELLYFIAFPIMKELQTWRTHMNHVSFTRKAAITGIAALFVLLLLIPWKSHLTLPALLTVTSKQPIYAPFAARIAKNTVSGKEVKKGELLFLLDADETRFQVRMASMQASELRDRLRRLPANQKGREQAHIWHEEALEREQAARSQSAELHRLELRAETAGIVMDADEGIHVGSYVTPQTLLAIVVDPSQSEVEAFADETEASRIKSGAKISFRSSTDLYTSLQGHVLSVDPSRLGSLPTPALADRHGGTIATTPTDTDRLIPRDSLYRVRIKLDSDEHVFQLKTGTVSIEVAPESLAKRLLRNMLSVIIRESSF